LFEVVGAGAPVEEVMELEANSKLVAPRAGLLHAGEGALMDHRNSQVVVVEEYLVVSGEGAAEEIRHPADLIKDPVLRNLTERIQMKPRVSSEIFIT